MNKKSLFDYVRGLLGRGFTQGEVERIDDILEGNLVPDAPSEPERDYTPAHVGPRGIGLIHEFEGFAIDLGDGRVKAYPDPRTGGVPYTIGYGSTTDEEGNPIARGTIWTRARAVAKSKQDLEKFSAGVIAALSGGSLQATSQLQFDAMVSLAYNIGLGNFRRSTLLRKHNAGDHAGAAREFIRWNRAAGRVMRGLTRRRKAEAALYREGMR